jgi:hypothetical protein
MAEDPKTHPLLAFSTKATSTLRASRRVNNQYLIIELYNLVAVRRHELTYQPKAHNIKQHLNTSKKRGEAMHIASRLRHTYMYVPKLQL